MNALTLRPMVVSDELSRTPAVFRGLESNLRPGDVRDGGGPQDSRAPLLAPARMGWFGRRLRPNSK